MQLSAIGTQKEYRKKNGYHNTQQNNKDWGISRKSFLPKIVEISIDQSNFQSIYTTREIQNYYFSDRFESEIKEVASLNDNWDEEGALKPDSENLKHAVLFIIFYGNSLLKNLGKFLPYPEVNPCRDGSIDLVWRDNSSFLIINFRDQSGQVANFYFDQYDPILGRQGGFVPSELDHDILNYLKKFV
ncbi:hypothetical protein SAMN00777080_3061 [Aquiflexum balticum DSM 16537]|uniref:Uncharacterized protein n=1 Tax=Aquiflexum balticum DSM 16537 TaxID=758820 RepID=A0A1W2H667_9BACT|nr:hypothetical protein [Aquiflexum balticum]SMD44440.1 hypothetical protein SAMN00777080_3061 [Aquiflexum balticum DSM 16537]